MTSPSTARFMELPALYLIATCKPNREWSDHLRRVEACLQGGAGIVQFREKNLSGEDRLRCARQIQDLAKVHGAAVVVNDDPRLARDLAATAVHLGQGDMSPAEARQIVGPDILVGQSTHSSTHIRAAAENPDVNYIGVGPIFDSRTKADREPVSPALAMEALSIMPTTRSVFPIGGINPSNIGELTSRSLHRAAIASGILDADDPREVCAQILKQLAPELRRS